MRSDILTFSAPKPLLDQVRQVADAEQVSLGEIVRWALKAEIARVRTFHPDILRDEAATR
jgi:hypothetical protein